MVEHWSNNPEGLGLAFFATGPGLGPIMYILTTLEFPKHNHDFYILTVSVNAKYYYNNYHKLTAGAQQNLGKLIIAGKLSGPSLVVTRRPLGELTRASATWACEHIIISISCSIIKQFPYKNTIFSGAVDRNIF